MIFRYFVVLFCSFYFLNAQELDSDFDGVIDKYDLCPNSSFDEIVNESGCSDNKKILTSIGIINSNEKNSSSSLKTKALNMNIKVEQNNNFFSFSYTNYLNYTYKNKTDNSLNTKYENISSDTFVKFGKYIYKKDFLYSYSFVLKLPTGNNDISTNSFDHGVSFSFDKDISKLRVFSNILYLRVKDSSSLVYKDEFDFSIGSSLFYFGKFTPSISYGYLDDSYIKKNSLNFSYLYKINEKLFINNYFNFAKTKTTDYDDIGFFLIYKF